jgi:ferredoxin
MAYVISNDCTACGTCIDECPVGAISEGEIYKDLFFKFLLLKFTK